MQIPQYIKVEDTPRGARAIYHALLEIKNNKQTNKKKKQNKIK